MKQESRKDEIIRVAANLFKEKGYSAVTMRDIAKTMGIKAASLYNHINSKQEILSNIIITLAETFTGGILQIKASDIDAVEKLKRIIALHVQITTDNQSGMASLNNDWMHLEGKLEYYLKMRLEYEDIFREIIEEGIIHGRIRNINSDVILFSILSTLRSLYIWIPKKEDLNAKLLAKDLAGVLLTGITK